MIAPHNYSCLNKHLFYTEKVVLPSDFGQKHVIYLINDKIKELREFYDL